MFKIFGHKLHTPPPPSPPPKVNGPDIGWGHPLGSLFPLWGGCGVLGFAVKGIRLRVDKGSGKDLRCMFCNRLRACI